jgi:hypothetical protein
MFILISYKTYNRIFYKAKSNKIQGLVFNP